MDYYDRKALRNINDIDKVIKLIKRIFKCLF